MRGNKDFAHLLVAWSATVRERQILACLSIFLESSSFADGKAPQKERGSRVARNGG
jgi:hypothetical protein